MTWPITWDDITEARHRIAPYLQTTPLRHYRELDTVVGNGIRVLVKHENDLPTGSHILLMARRAIAGTPDRRPVPWLSELQ